MMKDRKLPQIERDCPKCPSTKFNGPEYRRGINNDTDLGEHLRLYCATCGFMVLEPTKDSDTPERRAELAAAFAARKSRPHEQISVDTSIRDRDIRDVRRGETTRRPYGWNR